MLKSAWMTRVVVPLGFALLTGMAASGPRGWTGAATLFAAIALLSFGASALSALGVGRPARERALAVRRDRAAGRLGSPTGGADRLAQPIYRRGNVNRLVESGRHLSRENRDLTEAEFRDRVLERFLLDEQGVQEGTARLTADPHPVGAVLGVLLLPVVGYRWLRSRRRLTDHLADMDEAVRALRREGHFGTEHAAPGTSSPATPS